MSWLSRNSSRSAHLILEILSPFLSFLLSLTPISLANLSSRETVRSFRFAIRTHLLKFGNNKSTKNIAITWATNAKNIDTPKNCKTTLIFFAPAILRIPISLALLADWAVDRFMKLIHAIKRINMATIEEYRKAGQELFDKLHLATYPVAIKYIKDIKEIPDKAIRPIVKGHKMAICQAFTQARRFGGTYAITSADNFCTPSSVGHGWVDISEEEYYAEIWINGIINYIQLYIETSENGLWKKEYKLSLQ